MDFRLLDFSTENPINGILLKYFHLGLDSTIEHIYTLIIHNFILALYLYWIYTYSLGLLDFKEVLF